MENLSELSTVLLKSACASLGIPSTGNKAQLVARLQKVNAEELQKTMQNLEQSRKKNDEDDVQQNLPLNDENAENQNVQTNDENDEQKNLPINDEDDGKLSTQTNDNNRQEKGDVDGSSAGDVVDTQLRDRELQMLAKENELLKREREVMQKENEWLKLMVNNSGEQNSSSAVSLNLISNFIANFDGNSDGNFWIAQLRDIQQTYKLTDNMLRVLFATKLVGRAQNWLHSRRNSAGEHIDELLNQFCLTFGAKDSKLEMRKKFEDRKWRYDEEFVDYFNEKLMLAGKLSLDEDELVEYMVDGIPSIQIRTQASMQRHNNSSELLKALVGIKLQKPKAFGQTAKPRDETNSKRTPSTSKSGVRCFNCNSIGHYAADCNKPKRTPGTCYACGSSEHMVSDCWQNKKKSLSEPENNYNA